MNKKPTKEELIRLNIGLGLERDQLNLSDEFLRKQFSEVLGASYVSSGFSYETKTKEVWSWSRIFCEVGKLLAKKEYSNLIERLKDLEFNLEMKNEAINELQNKQAEKK
mgnify:CR=1 FL=1